MKEKHTRKILRLQEYDYNQPGAYFVTICTKNREHHFGTIQNDAMELSEIGKIAERCWQEIPQHFSDVELDAFVIMPNHIHAIIHIVEEVNIVGDSHGCPLPETSLKDRPYQKIPIVINAFKSTVSREIRKHFLNHTFSWQRSYYDHIIRDEKELENIREYIALNPLNWALDQENL